MLHFYHLTNQCLIKFDIYYALVAMPVAPRGLVLPPAVEFIENTDEHGKPYSCEGEFRKQDCGLKAFYRLAASLKEHYPRLPICLLPDGLYCSRNVLSMLCAVENSTWMNRIVDWIFSVRLTGDMNIAGRMNGKRQPQDIHRKAVAIFRDWIGALHLKLARGHQFIMKRAPVPSSAYHFMTKPKMQRYEKQGGLAPGQLYSNNWDSAGKNASSALFFMLVADWKNARGKLYFSPRRIK